MRRILLALTLCVGLLIAGSPHASAVPTDLDSCPTDRPTLYDVTIGNTNVADFASDGHVWALDSYLQHVQVWKIGQKHYCFRIEYDGTWTSFAGVSPGGTGTISEGLTGTFYGLRILRLTGEFNPQYPLSGHVADFDWQCQADGTCTGLRPSPAMYFSPITNANITWSEFHATSAANGTWHDTTYGYSGDITD
ncbi:hypothetical protein ACWZJV_04695 [Nocardioides sp. WG-D5]|uniref:hypothetical protein n=1 Tax=Nocardioides luteus TaxID=1844 RepID=UPI0018CB8C9A|nr:hypothetical protein [Nocardioides luteus]MBG6095611.1 hypothetical protein [Nocardioides luteus]